MSADQGTAAWLQERCGFATASRIKDVQAKIKSGEAASRANYRAELVAQRLTGQVQESFTNAAMERGTELEPFARAAYEIRNSAMVQETGFIKHPRIEWSGASPDGLVGDDGLLEIKCPNTSTHIGYLLDGSVPSQYIPQMTWQIACTGRKWCDFASYDPRMPEDLQLFVIRFAPTEEQIKQTEQDVIAFLAEVDSVVKKLEAMMREPMREAA